MMMPCSGKSFPSVNCFLRSAGSEFTSVYSVHKTVVSVEDGQPNFIVMEYSFPASMVPFFCVIASRIHWTHWEKSDDAGLQPML